MKGLLLFIILFNSAYGIEECSVNENFVVNDYKDVKKFLEEVPANKFSLQFCQSMSVCYGEKSSKTTCDFFEGFYEEALISLEKRKLGTCGMSKEELTLLKYYTTAGFTCLNSHLRGLKTNPNISYLVEVMKNAINKLPAYRGLVRRGARLPDSERDKYFEGNMVSDKAFMSSSTFQGFAFNFTEPDSSAHPWNITIRYNNFYRINVRLQP